MITLKKTKERQSVDSLLYVPTVFFVIGMCLGGMVVYHSDLVSLYSFFDTNAGSFLDSLWCAAQFHLLVCAAGIWSAGVILVPLIVLVRGCVLVCAAAVVGMEQAAAAWIICGLPAIVQLPSLFLLACAAMRFSARLCDKALRRDEIVKQLRIGRVIIWSVVGIVLCACVDCYVVPMLIALFIS